MLRILSYIFGLGLFLAVVAGGGAVYLLYYYGKDLPDHEQLAEYEPPNLTRVYGGDGRMVAEFATERRFAVPYEAIPQRVVDAFLSAEDKNFFEHPGVDPISVLSAAGKNLLNYWRDRRPIGASTITQQVAKNFLLTNEVSIERKVKEAIIALRMERAFTKQRIIELYLNEIYLGIGSYGVAAAALNYFNKALDELTIAECAYLAALPKAPNNYHPLRRHDAAVARRNWVIGRMLEDGRITPEQAAEARVEPLTMVQRDEAETAEADYFAEEVRRELERLYGADALYEGGLTVRATIDPALQEIADRVLREGLRAYDERHGWRGPVTRLEPQEGETAEALAQRLSEVERPKGALDSWHLALVTEVGKAAQLLFADGSEGEIPMEGLAWARPWLEDQRFGPAPKMPADVLSAGDVVFVERLLNTSETEDAPAEAETQPESEGPGHIALRQIPAISGALVALDPHSGRVLAMSGGFSFEASEFNRATQATRQPGSAFKPFVYLAAMEQGFTPATIVLDAPVVLDQGPGLPKWKPTNYGDKFFGPSPLRLGIEKSRNLMTVRLAQAVGMDRIVDVAGRFGIIEDMPPVYSMALGAGETSVIKLTTAYAMLANGGKKITPRMIDRIQNRYGETIYSSEPRRCDACKDLTWQGQPVPEIAEVREAVTDPQSAYQIVSMLEGVVQHGTGRRIASLGRPLAGKTGTTNDSFDTWFVGFSPDLTVGVFAGFDEPRTLGKKETGSSVAAPIFKAFMAEALADEPPKPFRVPSGIRMVRVEHATGLPVRRSGEGVILEAFKAGTEPDPRAISRAYQAFGSLGSLEGYMAGNNPGYGLVEEEVGVIDAGRGGLVPEIDENRQTMQRESGGFVARPASPSDTPAPVERPKVPATGGAGYQQGVTSGSGLY